MRTIAQTQTMIIQDSDTQKTIFRVLVCALIILSLCYVYFIGSITFNVLARKSLEINKREVANRVGGLELEYLALASSINAKFGQEIGFVDAKETIFARRIQDRVALR